MQKHLLLTVGDDMSASYSLRFMRDFFTDFCSMRITLLYVAPKRLDRTDSGQKNPQGQAVLDKAKKWFTENGGCAEAQVETMLVPAQVGTAEAILFEGHRGLYDAVILGQRGYFWIQQMMQSGVSHSLLEKEFDFPIWICKRPSPIPQKNVLLGMDESAPCLRMADHMGYILSSEPQHDITLFHAHIGGKATEETLHNIEEAEKILLKHGIARDRIRPRIIPTRDPGKALIEEAARLNVGVVGVGRGAHKKTLRESLFAGSVSLKLLHDMEHRNLWISK
jgi:nucleotide-binding universal stress UspA family protein